VAGRYPERYPCTKVGREGVRTFLPPPPYVNFQSSYDFQIQTDFVKLVSEVSIKWWGAIALPTWAFLS